MVSVLSCAGKQPGQLTTLPGTWPAATATHRQAHSCLLTHAYHADSLLSLHVGPQTRNSPQPPTTSEHIPTHTIHPLHPHSHTHTCSPTTQAHTHTCPAISACQAAPRRHPVSHSSCCAYLSAIREYRNKVSWEMTHTIAARAAAAMASQGAGSDLQASMCLRTSLTHEGM